MDPLALDRSAPAGAALRRPAHVTVLHAGDNDLAHLKRRYGLRLRRLFDTVDRRALPRGPRARPRRAARDVPRRRRCRPRARRTTGRRGRSRPAQERYAAADVQHLLRAQGAAGRGARDRSGRLAWVEEECAALAAAARSRRPARSRRLRGPEGRARPAAARSLAVLRELYEAARAAGPRDATGRRSRSSTSDTLLAVALRCRAMTPRWRRFPASRRACVQRWGGAIARGGRARRSRCPRASCPCCRAAAADTCPGATRRRIEALRRWRTGGHRASAWTRACCCPTG